MSPELGLRFGGASIADYNGGSKPADRTHRPDQRAAIGVVVGMARCGFGAGWGLSRPSWLLARKLDGIKSA